MTTSRFEEQTASAVREEELRGEYARAAENLKADLSAEASQHFFYLEQQQNSFAQAPLRTVESALGCEHASAQENLQQEYLRQVRGLHSELQIAQGHFSDLIAQERAAKGQELEALRRELAEKSQLTRKQADDLQQNARMHRETLAAPEPWKIHCDELTEQFNAERLELTQQISDKERDIDDLSAKFIEASEKLEQWDIWWQEGSTAQVAREVEPIDRQHPEGLTTINCRGGTATAASYSTCTVSA